MMMMMIIIIIIIIIKGGVKDFFCTLHAICFHNVYAGHHMHRSVIDRSDGSDVVPNQRPLFMLIMLL